MKKIWCASTPEQLLCLITLILGNTAILQAAMKLIKVSCFMICFINKQSVFQSRGPISLITFPV